MPRSASSSATRKVLVRIDRTELSKNIVRGLLAFRELLATHPEWRERVVHLALAYPSRHDLPEYRAYTAEVMSTAAAINDELGTPGWRPVELHVEDDFARSLAAYRLADVLLVNPLRDGMNLVAKEGPVITERGCVLVLSREAGAATSSAPTRCSSTRSTSLAPPRRSTRRCAWKRVSGTARCARLATISGANPPSAWLRNQLAALD